MKQTCLFVTALLTMASLASAQKRVEPIDARATTQTQPDRLLPGNTTPSGTGTSDYVLGPGDQITLMVTDLEEQFTDKIFRIDMSGDLNVPLAGRVHAAGLTSQGLEKALEQNFDKILKQPEVVVGIEAFASQPISILGEVNTPGVHQIAGGKNLFEALSIAGGFTEEVGNTVTITRHLKWGAIPLANAHADPTLQFSVASLSVKDILHAKNPADNIPVMPEDVISVSKGEVVYAVGSVNKPGGFILGQDEGLSTLQVLSLAEGLNRTAAPQKAMILRLSDGTKQRTEITVNLKTLMEGSGTDVPLRPGDILFVPTSRAKTVSYRTLEAIVQTATGVAIYGRY